MLACSSSSGHKALALPARHSPFPIGRSRWWYRSRPAAAPQSCACGRRQDGGSTSTRQSWSRNRAGGGGTVGTRRGSAKARPTATRSFSATPARWRSPRRCIRTPGTTRARFRPYRHDRQCPQLARRDPSSGKSVQELIAYAKANPGKVQLRLGRCRNHEPRGRPNILPPRRHQAHACALSAEPGPALADLIGGHIPMALAPIPAATGRHHRASCACFRSPAPTSSLVPDQPTVAEAAGRGFRGLALLRIVAPAGTPAPIVERLNQALREGARER